MLREIEQTGCLDGAVAVWSLWPGYLEQLSTERLRDFLQSHHIPLSVLHASGHAYVQDLQRLAQAVSPARVVPIHSFAPQRFAEFLDNVEPHDDGEWWEC